jgi:PAS domain S-box-containing protein
MLFRKFRSRFPFPGGRRLVVYYGLALACTVAAAALRYWLSQSFGATFAYLTFYPAIVVVAMFGGFGPGLLATLLSAIFIDYLFLPPSGSLEIRRVSDSVGMVLFSIAGLGISGIAAVMRRSQVEVQRSEQRLQLALDAGEVGTWEHDLKKNTLACNPRLGLILGSPFSPPVGPPESFLSRHVLAEDRDRVYEILAKGAATAAFSLECRIERPDLSIRWVRVQGKIIRDLQGHPTKTLGTIVDITERKLLEEQLLQAQKLEAVGQLAGGVAHDFNNIMGVILGYAGLVREGLGADNPTRPMVENIENAARRGAGVTRQLLALSRKQVMRPRVLELNDLIAELSKILGRLIGENIALELHLTPDVARIQADPGQIEQVIMNLVVNARDAMPKGGKLTIVTANVFLDTDYQKTHPAVIPGKYAMFSVADTGTGMDERTLSHIFEPFYTTKEPGEGTGLGLAIVYGIVEQSGGHISVFSEPGQGTHFKIYLPAVDRPKDVEAVPASAPEPAQASGTILVVEDEPGLADLTRTILAMDGYSVLLAGNGEDALGLVSSHADAIQLVLTDIVLPGPMNGVDLASGLRSLRPETKVVYMSGYSDVLNTQPHPAGEPVILLEKPFSPETLRKTVRELMAEPAKIPAPLR